MPLGEPAEVVSLWPRAYLRRFRAICVVSGVEGQYIKLRTDVRREEWREEMRAMRVDAQGRRWVANLRPSWFCSFVAAMLGPWKEWEAKNLPIDPPSAEGLYLQVGYLHHVRLPITMPEEG